MSEIIKGYKVTDENMKCQCYQYELDKQFVHKGEVKVCASGFHFCNIAADCFNYYSFTSTNRVFEIEASGEVETEGDKSCAKKIKFIREISWEEVLKIVNTGKDNSGLSNSGNSNSGDRNSGDSNSGYRNSGNWNSGNWNSGDRNSGDSNSGYRNSGAFCTEPNPPLILFDKVSKMSVKEWEQTKVCELMYSIEPTIWVPESIMTDEEKKSNPKYQTTAGYLKSIPIKEAWANFWHNLSDTNKTLFTSLENFDNKKFEEITGLKI